MSSFTHEDNICSICLTPKHIEDKYIHKIHVCNHTFHVKCLNMWYDTCHNSNKFSATCPLCKRDVISVEHANVYKIGGVYLFNPKNTNFLYSNIECYESDKIAYINSFTDNKPSFITFCESVNEYMRRVRHYKVSDNDYVHNPENTDLMLLDELSWCVSVMGYSTATYIYLMKIGHLPVKYLN